MLIVLVLQISTVDGRSLQSIDIGSTLYTATPTPEVFGSMADDGFYSKWISEVFGSISDDGFYSKWISELFGSISDDGFYSKCISEVFGLIADNGFYSK